MEPAFFLFLIFGICLILAAGWIFILKDPRDSIFFCKAHSLRKMSLPEARIEAKKTAKYVAIIGAVMTIICIIGILLTI